MKQSTEMSCLGAEFPFLRVFSPKSHTDLMAPLTQQCSQSACQIGKKKKQPKKSIILIKTEKKKKKGSLRIQRNSSDWGGKGLTYFC